MHIVFSIDTPFLAPQNSFCTRKLHVWKAVYVAFACIDICMPTTGECLSCQTEDSNTFDLYVVAIRKSANVTGHVRSSEDFCCLLSFCAPKEAL